MQRNIEDTVAQADMTASPVRAAACRDLICINIRSRFFSYIGISLVAKTKDIWMPARLGEPEETDHT